jgi:hypothetical protein
MFKTTIKKALTSISNFIRDTATNIIPNLLTGSVITMTYLPTIGWICIALLIGWIAISIITKLL